MPLPEKVVPLAKRGALRFPSASRLQTQTMSKTCIVEGISIFEFRFEVLTRNLKHRKNGNLGWAERVEVPLRFAL